MKSIEKEKTIKVSFVFLTTYLINTCFAKKVGFPKKKIKKTKHCLFRSQLIIIFSEQTYHVIIFDKIKSTIVLSFMNIM